MMDLEQLARYESANSAVAFRETAYRAQDRPALLRDVIGLANADIDGPRYLFLGISDGSAGDRRIAGIADAEIRELQEVCGDLVARYVEPLLLVRVEEVSIEGATIPVIVLPDCGDPPYLLKKNASAAMRAGAGWLRQGTALRRLLRSDLEHMFERKLLRHGAGAALRVTFDGRAALSSICLPVMSLDQLPSRHAREKYGRLLAAKHVSRNAREQVGSRIERLVHAQVFGEDRPYAPSSTATLVRHLQAVDTDCAAADRHYSYEVRAHKVNLVIENVGGAVFDRGTLVLDIPSMAGLEIPARVAALPGCPSPAAERYPAVEVVPRGFRIQAAVGSIAPGASAAAFREPLRVCLREQMLGATLPIRFMLFGRGLRNPVSGVLRIEVVAA